MKRRAVVVVAVAAGLAWALVPGGPPEPTYRGKRLSAWLDEREVTKAGPVVLPDEAERAVRAIGPAAVPTLTAWLRRSDTAAQRHAKMLLEWRLKVPVSVPTHQRTRLRAMYGFRVLGAAAKGAFPEIVSIALNSPDDWQRTDAINSLTSSDADAMRLLAAGLKSPDREVRLRAIFALACLRIAPDEVCIPALEGALKDKDPKVRAKVSKAIALIEEQLETLARWWKQRDPESSAIRVRLIGDYRTRARKYLPELEAAANDDDPRVREAARNAIEQVRGRDTPAAGN